MGYQLITSGCITKLKEMFGKSLEYCIIVIIIMFFFGEVGIMTER